MHELEVVASIIALGGNRVGQKFIDHEVIDGKKAADQYQKDYSALGYKKLSKQEIVRIENEAAEAIKKYGSEFNRPFGWAASFLKNNSPRFVDLEKAAGNAWMRSHYKFASYNIHASSKSLSTSTAAEFLGEWPIAGATNAGLLEPGQNTAVTLLRTTYLLMRKLTSSDNVILMTALLKLRDQTIENFTIAHRQLSEEERYLREAGDEYEIEIDTRMI